MRHRKSGRQLSRNSSHRWALMRNLVTALLRDEKIQTTDPKAKELRRWADRVFTLGKEGSLHAHHQSWLAPRRRRADVFDRTGGGRRRSRRRKVGRCEAQPKGEAKASGE